MVLAYRMALGTPFSGNDRSVESLPGAGAQTEAPSEASKRKFGGVPIAVGHVLYAEKGQWASGQSACEEYIRKACEIIGVSASHWLPGMLTIALRESSFNDAKWQVNTNDTNAKGAAAPDGFPANCSRGGWQCIPATFAQYHQPGTSRDIYNPIANCAASMNYIMGRYKVLPDGSNLSAKVQQADPNRRPKGY